MNIAELFVNLGIKGAEKTVGALGSVRKGLGEVSNMSLEAKAAIAAAVYGLERLMQASGQTGTNLTNFSSLTGLSTKTLQQWQYAARQAGVSGEEFTGSIRAVQNSMTNMLLGKGAPEGMGMLARTVGFDPKKIKDTFYVMEKLQEFARKAPPELAQSVIKSFGVNEGTIAAMRRNMFRPDVFKKAPLYSSGEIGQLDKTNIAWSNLGNKIQMAIGHFTSKHGLQIVTDISKITDSVFKLVEALEQLSEKLKLFQALGKVLDVTAKIVEGWGLLLDDMSGKTSEKDAKKHPKLPSGLFSPGSSHPMLTHDKITDFLTSVNGLKNQELIAPSPSMPMKHGNTQHIQVQQTLQFQHDGKDHKKTGDSVHKAVRDSYRQLSAQSQGS